MVKVRKFKSLFKGLPDEKRMAILRDDMDEGQRVLDLVRGDFYDWVLADTNIGECWDVLISERDGSFLMQVPAGESIKWPHERIKDYWSSRIEDAKKELVRIASKLNKKVKVVV